MKNLLCPNNVYLIVMGNHSLMLLVAVYKQGGSNMTRNIFSSLILFLLLVYGTSCNNQQQSKPVDSVQQSQTRMYEVFGMDCPGCHGGLEKLVKKIPAVEDAKGNWIKKQVVVTVRPGVELNDEDIYDAIKRSNFTPGKIIK